MAAVNPLLESIGEDVMGFLNEIQLLYPQAISLASGRPDEQFFDIGAFPGYFDVFVDAVSAAENRDKDKVLKGLGQYNKTKGIINEHIARYLQNDEEIAVDPEDIIVTVGSQEAMAIAVITLCDKEKDVILVEDPTYVGITHFSLISGYSIDEVSTQPNGGFARRVEERITHHKSVGKNVKLLYIIPDFQNPTGARMPEGERQSLLDLALRHDFYILEDNAYGEFSYNEGRILPIKAIDTHSRVIYMRSFSKTIYPSLRLSAMVADQMVGLPGNEKPLSDLMARTKGYLTVNTPSINQAILGGMLIQNKFSLKRINQAKVDTMRGKRDLLLSLLHRHLAGMGREWAEGISWNEPEGGFFMTIRVPFSIGKAEVVFCAENFGVIFTPMSFFYVSKGGECEIRIAYSNVGGEDMEQAIDRMVCYFKSRLKNKIL